MEEEYEAHSDSESSDEWSEPEDVEVLDRDEELYAEEEAATEDMCRGGGDPSER